MSATPPRVRLPGDYTKWPDKDKRIKIKAVGLWNWIKLAGVMAWK